jgi:hypothetical protein
MLLILIPTIWFGLMSFAVAVCKIAARGDAVRLAAADPGRVVHEGLVVWEEPLELEVQDSRR